MQRVMLESPYAGDVEVNLAYLAKCERDCLLRGEAPFASHRAYTTALDDNDPEERSLGIDAGMAYHDVAEKMVVYTDLGISRGMQLAIEAWGDRPIEHRSLRKANRIIALYGLSGAGKTTLQEALNIASPNVKILVSDTTRQPRPGEKDGLDYFFVWLESFRATLDAGNYIEAEEYGGNYYGLRRSQVDNLRPGDIGVVVLNGNGVRALQLAYPELVVPIYVSCSCEERWERLLKRYEDPTLPAAHVASKALDRYKIEEPHEKMHAVVFNYDFEDPAEIAERILKWSAFREETS